MVVDRREIQNALSDASVTKVDLLDQKLLRILVQRLQDSGDVGTALEMDQLTGKDLLVPCARVGDFVQDDVAAVLIEIDDARLGAIADPARGPNRPHCGDDHGFEVGALGQTIRLELTVLDGSVGQ